MKNKRIVVKIGTNLLANNDGTIDSAKLGRLAKDIAEVYKSGIEVILVSSGAIACGVGRLKLKKRPTELPEKQAAAAVGQPLLMKMYEEQFSKYAIPVAQLLLTWEDFDNRNRYINTRNTFLSLLKLGAIPIVNENDTVSTEEIKFGENDTLSSLVAIKTEADMLVILTDVGGLYTQDPNKDKKAQIIPEVKKITDEIEKIAGSSRGSVFSSGGMLSKVKAAKMAVKSGVETVIANGCSSGCLQEIVSGKAIGTKFLAGDKVMDSRKRWIAFGAKVRGRILVDSGAAKAVLEGGKSLLPSGIVFVEGIFGLGDNVSIAGADGKEIARGLASFSSQDLNKIKGKKSSEISKILGKTDYTEAVNRDNLVIL